MSLASEAPTSGSRAKGIVSMLLATGRVLSVPPMMKEVCGRGNDVEEVRCT